MNLGIFFEVTIIFFVSLPKQNYYELLKFWNVCYGGLLSSKTTRDLSDSPKPARLIFFLRLKNTNEYQPAKRHLMAFEIKLRQLKKTLYNLF